MDRAFTFMFLPLFAWPVHSLRCPFPGIPANGYGVVERNGSTQTIALWTPKYFNPGEKVDFHCRKGWKKPNHVDQSLKCEENGTWTGNMTGWRGGLPRCDRRLSSKLLLNKRNITEEGMVKTEWLLILNQSVNFISEILVTNQVKVHQVEIWGSDNVPQQCSPSSVKEFNCEHVKLSGGVIAIAVNSTNISQVKSLTAIVSTGDYCGHPPVPLDTTSFSLTNDNRTARFVYVNGNNVRVNGTATCDRATGEWKMVGSVSYSFDTNESTTMLIGIGVPAALTISTILAIVASKKCFRLREENTATRTSAAEPGDDSPGGKEIYEHLSDYRSPVFLDGICSNVPTGSEPFDHCPAEADTSYLPDTEDGVVYSTIEHESEAENIYASIASIPPASTAIYAQVCKKPVITDIYAIVDKSKKVLSTSENAKISDLLETF